ncbi:hypothetical protein ABT237_16835 [Streptomyces sp. NPDC001581]|uniref:hypothetical protein n=1 Tax=Streptomyces sp. NPDC001581 TaxID=3154386 RepID=UPI00331CC9F8
MLDAADRTRPPAAELGAGTAGLLRLGAVHGPGERMKRLQQRLAQPVGAFRVVLRHLPVAERLRAVRTPPASRSVHSPPRP